MKKILAIFSVLLAVFLIIDVSLSSFDDQDKWLFNFVYQGPKPILFGGRNTQSYYFEMLSAAPTIYKIYQDGISERIAS